MPKRCSYRFPDHMQCSRNCYGQYCIQHKPRKRIRQISDKQAEYHKWLEEVARPYLIEKFGNVCSCCMRTFKTKLDIEHTKEVGSHAELKKDLNNMTLMCRFPCHRNKTDNKECLHEDS